MSKLIKLSESRVAFHCPGCRGPQQLPITGSNAWGFNGDFDKPTFTPSILTRWETVEKKHVCHSYVTDGKIQFLSDCTHSLAGQTVDLKDVLTEDDLFESVRTAKDSK